MNRRLVFLETDAAHKVLKARVGAQCVVMRLDFAELHL
jgi:hypothetical protein